ncbi:Formylglycine-generating enzyme, required for sulfatase activity, contains SUMF1/FGE domain [Rhodovulum sp. ES.010]|uniref:formylglycine-generating enzyme family protein n=1 Tax=Rhodovulum sp. ES.010 TaxID=1882821 RepID=UPI000929CE72|nr:SUMF1/EgtB/PvdO family nonheme iron enzyme [Rhodovulum sp. ES.010]SIO59744.1 Formylglycine-generating enzyme, required for sulfatase activity, contains SUMF1/FGE domain [Rhodovulum sp. ES.010]
MRFLLGFYLLRALIQNFSRTIMVLVLVGGGVAWAENASLQMEGLDFVTVGSPNNPVDPATGTGSVSYPYMIGRFEITNSDYAAFLNAVEDPSNQIGLFNPLMQSHFWGGIARGENPEAPFRPKPGYSNLPVTFVSWFDAVRFVNWLHYGRPEGRAGTLGVTEGTLSEGAYDTTFSAFEGISRNDGARFWLPSLDEWRKAAFYDGSRHVWNRFATGAAPSNIPGPDRKSATFFSAGRWTAPFPHLTPAGFHANSKSPWGTFDQAGNVAEWIEHARRSQGTALGGSLFMDSTALESDYIDGENPMKELSTFGFRVATARRPWSVPDKPVVPPSADREAPVNRAAFLGADYLPVPANRTTYDPVTGRGLVFDDFLISRTELTNTQWITFLNEMGPKVAERFCLFAPAMEGGLVSGLERRPEGSKPAFRVKPGWEDRPVTYVSWYAAARFANWAHYRLTPDPADDGQIEGTDKTGAYDTRNFPKQCGQAGRPEQQPESRNPGALAFLPTVDEWYLAAFADRSGGSVTRFWTYPTRSDQPPDNLDKEIGANYQIGQTLGEGPPYYVARVDSYAGSPSPSGTLQQGGNVWEWAEDWKNRGNGRGWRGDEWTRGILGGSFNYIDLGLNRRNVDPGAPYQIYPFYGVRLAMSPDAPPARSLTFPEAQPDGWIALPRYVYAGLEGRLAILFRKVAVTMPYQVLAIRALLIAFGVVATVLVLGIFWFVGTRLVSRRRKSATGCTDRP